MTEEDKNKILGKKGTPDFYYRFDDFKYITTPKDRILSGIRDLDYDLKGFEMGCVTLWTGFTNAGKTTVMTMLAKKTIDQGERIFFFNGEQTKEDFKNNLYIQCVENKYLIKKQYRNSCVEDTFVAPEKVAELEKNYGNKIYIYNNEINRNIDTLLYAMEELRRTQKIRVFFLDNFMQIETVKENIYQEQAEIMEKIRTFAVNNKVHVHLVAHPRKTERFQVRLSLYDVAGSSNMVNKAYNIISIIRLDNLKKDNKEYQKLEEDLTKEGYRIDKTNSVLDILKTKGNRCGVVGLTYVSNKKTYIPAEKMTEEEKEKKKHQENKNKQEEMDLPW